MRRLRWNSDSQSPEETHDRTKELERHLSLFEVQNRKLPGQFSAGGVATPAMQRHEQLGQKRVCWIALEVGILNAR